MNERFSLAIFLCAPDFATLVDPLPLYSTVASGVNLRNFDIYTRLKEIRSI